jgi:uncharacterized phage-associated protein
LRELDATLEVLQQTGHETRKVTVHYDHKKAAQVAAFFLSRQRKPMDVIMLAKLMYLAERRSLQLHGEPIVGDRPVSMEHGPVLSNTYNSMKGECAPNDPWRDLIADRKGDHIALRAPIDDPRAVLLELSDADHEVLEWIWKEYGHLSPWKLRDMTHQGLCPEWEDPGRSSKSIPRDRLMRVLGYSEEVIAELMERWRSEAQMRGKVRRALG